MDFKKIRSVLCGIAQENSPQTKEFVRVLTRAYMLKLVESEIIDPKDYDAWLIATDLVKEWITSDVYVFILEELLSLGFELRKGE